MFVVEKTQEANGFTALNCEDGFRKDNRLWFGECSVCGERITNSALKGIWEHTLILEQGHNYTKSRNIDYCPANVTNS